MRLALCLRIRIWSTWVRQNVKRSCCVWLFYFLFLLWFTMLYRRSFLFTQWHGITHWYLFLIMLLRLTSHLRPLIRRTIIRLFSRVRWINSTWDVFHRRGCEHSNSSESLLWQPALRPCRSFLILILVRSWEWKGIVLLDRLPVFWCLAHLGSFKEEIGKEFINCKSVFSFQECYS